MDFLTLSTPEIPVPGSMASVKIVWIVATILKRPFNVFSVFNIFIIRAKVKQNLNKITYTNT